MLTLFPRTQYSLVTIGLLIATALFCSPNRADAGCGDYLTILNADGKVASHHSKTDPSAPRPPCHGPRCSAPQAPQPTPVSMPMELSSRAKEWATNIVVITEGDTSFVHHITDGNLDQPIKRTSEPFHPPRPF